MLRTPMGKRIAPELQPEGPDQKSTVTTLISVKNRRGWMCNSQPKGQIGLGVQYGSPFLLGWKLNHALKIISCETELIFEHEVSKHAFS